VRVAGCQSLWFEASSGSPETIRPVDFFDRPIEICSGSRLKVGANYFLPLDFSAFPLSLGLGDLLPYQDEYSKELRNSCFSPQTLQLPWLTAPLGGSITQW